MGLGAKIKYLGVHGAWHAVRSSGLARIGLFGFFRSTGRKRGHGWPIQGPKDLHKMQFGVFDLLKEWFLGSAEVAAGLSNVFGNVGLDVFLLFG